MTTPHTATDQPVALLRKKLASNDVLDLTVQDLGSQQFRAVVNRVLSNRICGFPANLAAIVFVGSPGHMGDVTLTDGQRALVFIRKVGDRYYEDPWHGHLTLEPFEDRLVAVAAWHLDRPGMAFGPEYLCKSAFTPDKSRPWRTAFPLELVERHVAEELARNDAT